MEYLEHRNIEPQYLERWLDVDARVIFEDRVPRGVWFRYRNGQNVVVEYVIPVNEDFDSGDIYGGLMAWDGRYLCTEEALELVAVKFGGKWYELTPS